MSAAWDEIWGARGTALRLAGLTALVLAVACGGESREASGAGSEGAAIIDTGTTPPADTAVATADTTASKPTEMADAGTAGDTVISQPAQPPAASAKPAAPAKPAPSKPAPPKPPAPKPAAADPAPAAPAQDTAAAAPSGAATGETQTASAPLRDAYHQAPKDTVDQTTYDGWKQYNLNCARCHGEDVLGTTIAPHLIVSLQPDGPINTQEAFVEVVCAGRPAKGMPSWCALGMDPAKINQIYAYVKGRSAGKIGAGRPAVKQEG